MTYEECLEFCTKRMCVMGYFPDEIEEAAKEMFEVERERELADEALALEIADEEYALELARKTING